MFCFFSFVTAWMAFVTSQHPFSVTHRLAAQLKDPLRTFKHPLRMPRRVPPLRVMFLAQWVICRQIILFPFYITIYIADFTWSLLWCLNFCLSFYISLKDHQDAARSRPRTSLWKCYALFSPSACWFWSSKLYFVMSLNLFYISRIFWSYPMILIVISQSLFIVSHDITWLS